jgi:hypothetical protein
LDVEVNYTNHGDTREGMVPRRTSLWLATLATVILFTTPWVASAQFDFVIEATSDTFVAVEPESSGVFHFTLSNSGSEDDIYALTALDSLPDDWFAVLCYKDRCVPAGATVYDTIAAGDQDTTIEITIYTTVNWDLGLTTLLVESTGDPSLVDSIRVWCLIGAYFTMIPVDDTLQTVPSGDTASCHFVLTNAGSFADTFEIHVTDSLPSGWDGWYELNGVHYSIGELAYDTLARGEADTIGVYMSTGLDEADGALWLHVQSGIDPEKADSLGFRVHAEPQGWVSEQPYEKAPSFVRLSCVPNPFRNRCVLWCNPGQGAGMVTVKVYDTVGRQVANLLETPSWEGERSVAWDPGDLPGGIYFARLTVAGETTSIKMTLIH